MQVRTRWGAEPREEVLLRLRGGDEKTGGVGAASAKEEERRQLLQPGGGQSAPDPLGKGPLLILGKKLKTLSSSVLQSNHRVETKLVTVAIRF